MSLKEIRITDIGSIARGLLSEEQEASVMGATSRGVFIHLPSRWVVFISSESYRGPLTLNSPETYDNLSRLKSGEPARIFHDRISIPESGVVIATGQASLWQASPSPAGILSISQIQAHLALIAQLVLTRQPASLLGNLLPVLLGFSKKSDTPGDAVIPLIEPLRSSLRQRDIVAITEALQAFLGLGGGLTPSGDDLVLGLLLALARWGHVLAPDLPVADLAHTLLPQAYHKTTTLAANLIECALQGQADERLLLALDGIMTGSPGPSACASALTAWGNTSGHDALVGMALTLEDW